ncbi:MAG: hypothetical protein KDI42_08890 [Gammaproteobacteria bacterium]|nr:hypothetical protein [Gammaproteobacteria bacterium]
MRLFLFFLLHLIASSATALDVVVNPEVGVTQLSRDECRALFSLQTLRWPDGTPVQVFTLADDALLHRQFTKQVLGLYPYQLRRHWDRIVFSGGGQAPIEVDSVQEMHRRVAKTRGAIGYMDTINPEAPPLKRIHTDD